MGLFTDGDDEDDELLDMYMLNGPMSIKSTN